jgi:hypothetical protein
MVVGEGAKRRMKFEVVEVHFNFTSHDLFISKNWSSVSTFPHTSDD